MDDDVTFVEATVMTVATLGRYQRELVSALEARNWVAVQAWAGSMRGLADSMRTVAILENDGVMSREEAEVWVAEIKALTPDPVAKLVVAVSAAMNGGAADEG